MISIKILKGFSLAEMMVVLLIMSVITAAFLPVMTKKTKNFEQLWQLTANNSDIYYGEGATQSVIVGNTSNSTNSKLLVNSSALRADQIAFQVDGNYTGKIKLDSSSNLFFGNPVDTNSYSNTNSIGNGANAGTNYSIAIGTSSQTQSSSSSNGAVAIGYLAYANGNSVSVGNGAKTNVSDGAVAIGPGSLAYGTNTISIGANAMGNASGGDNNIALGQEALSYNTTGSENVGIGHGAMKYYTSGIYNVAFGRAALQGTSGETNSGSYNSAFGAGANSRTSSGAGNTGIGENALNSNHTGNYNTALGYGACINVTGSNKTCIGTNSGPSSLETQSSDNSDVVYIGTENSTVYIPGNLVVGKTTIMGARSANDNVNYPVYLKGGNKGATSSWVFLGTDDYVGGDDNFYRVDNVSAGPFTISGGNGTIYSDRRLKNLKGLNNDSLDKIRELKVYNYTFKKDKKKVPQVGVIAQDLEKVFPNAVAKDKRGYLMIRKDDIFYAMLNSIKQLDKTIQEISKKVYYVIADLKNIHTQIFTLNNKDNENTKKIDDLCKKYNNMNAELSKIKKENHALTVQIKKLEAKSY